MFKKIQAFKHSSIQALKHSSIQALKHSSIQALKHSSIQALKHSSIQALKHSSIQALKHSSILFAIVFFNLAVAQNNKMTLLQPTSLSHNLSDNPRKVVVIQRYASGNDVNFQETYIFDNKGNLTEYRKRGFGGENVTTYPLSLSDLEKNRKYKFDYDGDLLELHQLDLRGRLIATTHCIYARGGNLVRSVEYTYDADSGQVIKRTVSDYDKNERLKTVSQYTADELLLWEESRKYDRRGNLTKRVQTFYNDNDRESTVEKRNYTFDSHGNWISCRYSLNGREIYSIEREISY